MSRECSIARHASPSRPEENPSKTRGRAVAHIYGQPLSDHCRACAFRPRGPSSFLRVHRYEAAQSSVNVAWECGTTYVVKPRSAGTDPKRSCPCATRNRSLWIADSNLFGFLWRNCPGRDHPVQSSGWLPPKLAALLNDEGTREQSPHWSECASPRPLHACHRCPTIIVAACSGIHISRHPASRQVSLSTMHDDTSRDPIGALDRSEVA